MAKTRRIWLTTLGAVTMACGSSEPRIAPFTAIDAPPPMSSGESSLAVGPDGALHLTWLERLPDSSVALRYARRQNAAWSTVRTVASGRDFFVNWADFPSVLVTRGSGILVHWLQRRPPGKYAYDAMLSRSSDSGETWSEAVRLHTDSTSGGEHGFVSLLAAGDSARAFWLDGRNAGNAMSHEGAMGVWSAAIDSQGRPTSEAAVDERTCDCCQTAAAMTGRGAVVAYRDRSPEEIRDIVVRRADGTGWTAAVPVHDDRWHIEACPVNGPGIVAAGDSVAVAWFTGAGDTARVQVAFSTDAAASFGPPTRVDGGNPAGRVALIRLAAGRVLVAWVERTDGERAEVRVRSVASDGRMSPPIVVAQSSAARASGFPRLAAAGDAVYASWTDPANGGRVRLAVTQIRR